MATLPSELPEKAKQTAEAKGLSIVALHDKDLALAKKYDIVFKLSDAISPMDQERLPEYNRSDALELPLSGTYVIKTSGKITYACFGVDDKKRAEPTEVIQAVKAAATQ